MLKINIFEIYGLEYIDHGSLKNNNIGFKLPKVREAIKDKVKKINRWYTLGNEKYTNFNKAKKVLHGKIYGDKLERETFYTKITYGQDNKINEEDYEKVKHFLSYYFNRGITVEIEHVFSANAIGQNFVEKDGHPDCIDKNGKLYKGRKCLEKVVYIYNLMISDLNILVPMLGHMNALRQDYKVAEIPGEKREFGDDNDFEISKENEQFEPPKERWGDVARMKLYMVMTYPEYIKIDNNYKELLLDWSKIDPISPEEAERYSAILIEQKSINPILHNFCIKKYPKFFNSDYFSQDNQDRNEIKKEYERYYKQIKEENKEKNNYLFDKYNYKD